MANNDYDIENIDIPDKVGRRSEQSYTSYSRFKAAGDGRTLSIILTSFFSLLTVIGLFAYFQLTSPPKHKHGAIDSQKVDSDKSWFGTAGFVPDTSGEGSTVSRAPAKTSAIPHLSPVHLVKPSQRPVIRTADAVAPPESVPDAHEPSSGQPPESGSAVGGGDQASTPDASPSAAVAPSAPAPTTDSAPPTRGVYIDPTFTPIGRWHRANGGYHLVFSNDGLSYQSESHEKYIPVALRINTSHWKVYVTDSGTFLSTNSERFTVLDRQTMRGDLRGTYVRDAE